MGLLNGMLGHASEIDTAKIEREFTPILVPGEVIEQAYQLIRDYFVFTNKRLVLVGKQGVTGSKVDYHSIPYKSITHFRIETAGTLDLEAELTIWISGTALPVQNKLSKKIDLIALQAVLARHVLP